MSYYYSQSSENKIKSCDNKIQKVCYEIIKYLDVKIIYGERTPNEQFELFKQGRELQNGIWVVTNPLLKVTNCDGTKLKSKHNYTPSKAIDMAWHPIRWNDMKRNYVFGGRVIQIADSLGINMIWGGNWDRDDDFDDQNLMDLVHFELVD